MRGRKPTTAVIDDMSLAIHAVPPPPSWLDKDARAEWRRLIGILMERKTLTLGDLGSLANYCAAMGQVIEASRIIKKEGTTFTGPTGPRKHPAVQIRNDAMTQARLLAAELGLTPVSRSRPSIRDDADADDDDLGLG